MMGRFAGAYARARGPEGGGIVVSFTRAGRAPNISARRLTALLA